MAITAGNKIELTDSTGIRVRVVKSPPTIWYNYPPVYQHPLVYQYTYSV